MMLSSPIVSYTYNMSLIYWLFKENKNSNKRRKNAAKWIFPHFSDLNAAKSLYFFVHSSVYVIHRVPTFPRKRAFIITKERRNASVSEAADTLWRRMNKERVETQSLARFITFDILRNMLICFLAGRINTTLVLGRKIWSRSTAAQRPISSSWNKEEQFLQSSLINMLYLHCLISSQAEVSAGCQASRLI